MFNGNLLRDAVISAANNLANNKKAVDDLNVFPVPDGDTGTNMSMTLSNAARELEKSDGETVGKVASITASALLRGARGNSGVITSLIFRGIANGFKNAEIISPENLSVALRLGSDTAYKAVMKPTEGTILTVIRIAADKAEESFAEGKDTLEVFADALAGAKEALAQTPELLPALKQAGVVDAGGKGLVLILEGMYQVLSGGKIIDSSDAPQEPETEQNEWESRNAAGEYETEITFTYCTEFIVNRNADCQKQPSELREFLENIGDCVVVVDDEEIIKVHVHTDHPGKALEEAITFGSLVKLKIENMRDQHERAKHDAEIKSEKKSPAMNQQRTETFTSADPVNDYGFVSVSAGEGLKGLFSDLGVDSVVSGGQTMNPSTDDILRAIEATPAKTVFVLPNNKNIIMAAEQAIPLSTRKVIVLHTRTIPQGITAMLNFDPDSDAESNAIAMQNAFENIGTGQITYAARNSQFDGKDIKIGELLALENGKVSFTETDIEKCAIKLIKNLTKKTSQVLTIIYGEDVSEEDAQKLEAAVNAKFGNKLDITMINGGQPVYYYIFSVE